MSIVRKTFECEVKAEAREGGGTRFRVIASSGSQDRHGEFLEPKGGRLVAGAQLLYGHDYWDLKNNIGVCLSMAVEGNNVIVEGEFDDTIPEHTNAIIAAKKAKKSPPSLNMVSVGFHPRVVKFANGEVRTLQPGEWIWPEPGLTYLEWDLVELSFVPVPANPEAELLSARSGESGHERQAGLVAALEAVLVSPQFHARLLKAIEPAPAPGGSGDAAPSDPGDGAKAPPADAPPDPAAKRLRIISDGTSSGTKLLLPDGTDLITKADVSRLSYVIDAHGRSVATLEMRAAADLSSAETVLQLADPMANDLDSLLSAEPIVIASAPEAEDDLDVLFSAEPAVVGEPGD